MKHSIEIFNRTIPLYGIFCLIGIMLASSLAYIFSKKEKLEFFDFTLVAIISLLSAFVGAKLLFIIVSWADVVKIFKSNNIYTALVSVLRGGFVFYGGLIGGAIGLLITLKIQKKPIYKWTNIYALVLPLGHAFGRIGCYFSGCCYGIKSNSWLSVTYANPLDVNTPKGISLLAVQLIEAFLLFLLFILLLILILNCKANYIVTNVYLISYSIIRFSLEFFRGDLERGKVLNLSTSQWISVFIFIISLSLTLFEIIKTKHKKSPYD